MNTPNLLDWSENYEAKLSGNSRQQLFYIKRESDHKVRLFNFLDLPSVLCNSIDAAKNKAEKIIHLLLLTKMDEN